MRKALKRHAEEERNDSKASKFFLILLILIYKIEKLLDSNLVLSEIVLSSFVEKYGVSKFWILL